MPEDKVTITADAGQYFDVLERAGSAGGRLARSGEEIGRGFLKGERVVETATRTITTGLLTAGSAGDAAAMAVEGFSRTLKLPLVAGAGLTAAVTAMVVLGRETAKTEKAIEELKKQVSVPLKILVGLSPADIAAQVQSLSKATEELRQRSQSSSERIRQFLQRQQFGFSDAPRIQAEITRAVERESLLRTAQANAELRIAGLKTIEAERGKEAAAAAKAELDYTTALSGLREERAGAPGDPRTTASFEKRGRALEIIRDSALAEIRDSITSSLRNIAKTFEQIKRSFEEDVGSGQFIQDLEQERAREKDRQRGRAIIADLEASREKGIPLGPNARAILARADELDKVGASLSQIARTDFSNLKTLSQYDFNGLKALSGLVISIK